MAQLPDSKGTEFWLAFPTNYDGLATKTLFISADEATSGTVTVPGADFAQAFTVAPGAVTAVVLPATSELRDPGIGPSVHVTAAGEVTVYGLSREQYTTDAYLGLPVDVLGTRHTVMAWGVGCCGRSQFAVAASQNDTKVTITPAIDTADAHPAGVPYDVTLDRGQAYMAQARSGDLTGSIVASDKPVAVFGGHGCANVPDSTFAACDHLVEQQPPDEAWGKDFLTVPLKTRRNGDTFRILASEDATEVRINGATVATLDAGQFHTQLIDGSSVISATKPVLVAQYSNGSDFDNVTSDPFMMLIPPFEQYQTAYTVSTPESGFARNVLNLVVPESSVGVIEVDGTTVPSEAYTTIGSSGFFGAQVDVALGSHTVTGAGDPFGVFVYGFDDFDSYGYPGGLSVAPITRITTVTLVPQSETLPVDREGCVTASVGDQRAIPVAGVRVDFSVTGANPTTGSQNTDAEGNATFCYIGTAGGTDSIVASVGQRSATASKTWVADDTAPIVTLTSPAQGSESTDRTPTYSGTAGTEPGDSQTVTVEVYEGTGIPDAQPYRSLDVERSAGSWSIEDASPLPPGPYTARARQGDAAGNEGVSAPVTFTIIDTTALTLSPETAENPVDTPHTVTATLTTNRERGASGRTILFTVAGANPTSGSATTGESGTATFTYTGTSPGTDTITACADLDDLTASLAGSCDADEPRATVTKQWIVVDTTPPDTTITSGPDGPTNDATPMFAFSSEAGATFACSVDGGEFVACESPYTTAALGEGPHRFGVRATDAADNTDDSPASRSFVVDTTAPAAMITTGPSGPTNDATPTFDFSSEPGATFECRVDSGEFVSCRSAHTTAALGEGPHRFAVRATDAAGNTGPAAGRSFVVDTTPPDTTITSGPDGPTNDTTPTFAFSSEAGATFACSVDGGAFVACESPYTTAALSDGPHTFQVRATDAADNTDDSPASRSFVVDTTSPQTTIDAGPSGPVRDATPAFEFSSEPGATFACSVDGGDFVACESPHTTAALSDGPHTFQVRARDAVGNVDRSPASRSFVVDTTGPTTTITAGPSGSIRGATPTFEFTSSEAGSTFECRVDSGDFAPCTSPHTTAALAEGPHTFQVRATDALGNTGPVASRSFVRDVTPPETQIVLPAAGATSSRPVIVFSSSEAGSTFECRVDGGEFEPCSSPYVTDASLPDGPHTFEVRAIDAAGNVGPVSSREFVRDSTPPEAVIASGPSGSVEDPQPTFEFSSSEPGSTFECSIDGGDFEPCESPFTTPPLPVGEHTFAVRARDAAGNTSAPVSRSFTVAAPSAPNPDPPPAGTQTPTSSASATTGSSATSTTPNPTATDRDGDNIPDAKDTCADDVDPNQADSDKDGIGNACENSEASGGPKLGESFVGRIVSGEVFVRKPNGSGLRGAARAAQASGTPPGFVPLKGAEILPVGTVVHSIRGRLSITSASGPRAGQTQRADFFKGIFTIRQKKARLPVTDLAVRSANFRQVCGSTTRSTAATSAQAAQAGSFTFVRKKRSKRVVSRLWGNGNGAFRTTGRNSAATVRGTKWLTQERCDGTLTYVASGSVSVRDLRRKKTIIVRAGRAYLARRP